jgi:hypothetical protein
MSNLKKNAYAPRGLTEQPAFRAAGRGLGKSPGKSLSKSLGRSSPREPDGEVFRIKVEYSLPFFFAALIALNLCALISLRGFSGPVTPPLPAEPAALPEPFEGLSSAFLQEPEPAGDLVSECYRNPLLRDLVTDFFSRIAGSREIAEIILAATEAHKIPPSLAFALSWEESRYRPWAVNQHNRDGSVDRGLFQLNSRSFPKLTESEFFDPRINTWHGISHLRWCLESGGSEIVGLSMYNAGSVRVNSNGAPKMTLEYVERVLASRRKIDNLFEAEVSSYIAPQLVASTGPASTGL